MVFDLELRNRMEWGASNLSKIVNEKLKWKWISLYFYL